MRFLGSIHDPHFHHLYPRLRLGSVHDEMIANYGVVMLTLAMLGGVALLWVYLFGGPH